MLSNDRSCFNLDWDDQFTALASGEHGTVLNSIKCTEDDSTNENAIFTERRHIHIDRHVPKRILSLLVDY